MKKAITLFLLFGGSLNLSYAQEDCSYTEEELGFKNLQTISYGFGEVLNISGVQIDSITSREGLVQKNRSNYFFETEEYEINQPIDTLTFDYYIKDKCNQPQHVQRTFTIIVLLGICEPDVGINVIENQ